MITLRNVGLLGVGVWDNKPAPIPVAAIDLQCAAYDWRVRRHVVPIQCQHDGTEVGTAHDLRVEGDELVGDLTLNGLGVDLIRRGVFTRVSVATDGTGVATKIKHVALVRAAAYTRQRPLGDYLNHDHQRIFAMSDLHQIKGLPIFAAGEWNGDKYTTADLDSMVEAFDAVGFRPAVKLGHDQTTGGRAWGWVTRIWRQGSQLMADLADIPAAIFDQIKQRAFDNVSAEIMWDLKRNGRTFSRVLSGLALLGGEVPAVDLPPIRSAQLLGSDFPARSYVMSFDSDTPANRRDAEARLHNLALQRAHDADEPYDVALGFVMSDPKNFELVGHYTAHTNSAAGRSQASQLLHEKALELQRADPTLTYAGAAKKAVGALPDVAKRWVGVAQ